MKKHKCSWCEGDALYEAYHDNEWGVPVYDDETLFEFLRFLTAIPICSIFFMIPYLLLNKNKNSNCHT